MDQSHFLLAVQSDIKKNWVNFFLIFWPSQNISALKIIYKIFFPVLSCSRYCFPNSESVWFIFLFKPLLYDDNKWYFVTKIVLTYCEKKMF